MELTFTVHVYAHPHCMHWSFLLNLICFSIDVIVHDHYSVHLMWNQCHSVVPAVSGPSMCYVHCSVWAEHESAQV